ncbi:uncharacterized protein G2W53_014558 [Senna tora]|uniref:Uncharacterized protein n=1 Tax=Senna tora TaxID=362788 RepID=A0A834WTS4_9FABA|nr:uncharacterized protein G2W53_014558 [Senna tora]
MPRLASNRTGVGGKRQGDFSQNNKRKKLKMKPIIGEISGMKRKTRGIEDLSLA